MGETEPRPMGEAMFLGLTRRVKAHLSWREIVLGKREEKKKVGMERGGVGQVASTRFSCP